MNFQASRCCKGFAAAGQGAVPRFHVGFGFMCFVDMLSQVLFEVERLLAHCADKCSLGLFPCWWCCGRCRRCGSCGFLGFGWFPSYRAAARRLPELVLSHCCCAFLWDSVGLSQVLFKGSAAHCEHPGASVYWAQGFLFAILLFSKHSARLRLLRCCRGVRYRHV